MSFVSMLLVRILIGAPVVFLLLMAFVWIVDRLFGDGAESILERVLRQEQAAAERDLWDRLAVGDEWL